MSIRESEAKLKNFAFTGSEPLQGTLYLLFQNCVLCCFHRRYEAMIFQELSQPAVFFLIERGVQAGGKTALKKDLANR